MTQHNNYATSLGRMFIAVAVSLCLAGGLLGQENQPPAQDVTLSDLDKATILAAISEKLTEEGRYDEALAVAQAALKLREGKLGPKHSDVATLVNNIAYLYFMKQNYKDAETSFRRSLTIKEEAFGTDDPRLLTTLHNLWELYNETGDYRSAIPYCQRSVQIIEKAFGEKDERLAIYLNNLGMFYYIEGNYAQAQELYERSLLILERHLGPEDPEVATTLSNLAELHRVKTEYGAAESKYRRALAIDEKSFGVDSPEAAVVLNNFGVLQRERGLFKEAEELNRRALAILEKAAAREWQRESMVALTNLADLHRLKGDYKQAESLYEHALRATEKAYSPNHPSIALRLNNLATLYVETGEYARAEPLYQRALGIIERAHAADHPDKARLLGNLAVLYIHKGDFGRAESATKRAIEIEEKGHGPNHPSLDRLLNHLAVIHIEKGELGEAEAALKRALAIIEKVLGPEHYLTVLHINLLAEIYTGKGKFGLAESFYKRALATSEKSFGVEHPDVAMSLNNLADVYFRKGDYKQAEAFFRRALRINEKVLGTRHPDIATTLENIAVIHERMGEVAEALPLRERASEIIEHNLSLVINSGFEEQKRLYMSKLHGKTNNVLRFHLRTAPREPRARDLAVTTVLRRKGRTLDAMSEAVGELRRRAAPADRLLLDKRADVYSRLAASLLKGPGGQNPAQYQEGIARLEQETEHIETELSARGVTPQTESRPVTLVSVREAIPAGAALVELVSYSKEAERAGGPTQIYVAYVVWPHKEPAWVELGGVDSITETIRTLRVALRNPQRGDVKQLARSVDEKVMSPVRKLLGDTRTVFLSPEGVLNLIPFGALVDEEGRYLLETYSFVYLTSGRDLLRPRRSLAGVRAPVIIAAPNFDPQPGDGGSDAAQERGGIAPSSPEFRERFAPLNESEAEAKAIAAILNPNEVLTGSKATESAVRNLHGPRILHISTHGFFLPAAKLEGDAAHTQGLRGAGKSRTRTFASNPLSRSGIALAGANGLRGGGGQDGVLTALEASGLDLWGTELVVLSACETGLGDVQIGEGVYGLRRALVLAGAASQVISLWKVNDEATRRLMVSFYERLKAGEGRAQALRNVQLEMLKSGDRNHPYFWASFIESGEWGKLDGVNQR